MIGGNIVGVSTGNPLDGAPPIASDPLLGPLLDNGGLAPGLASFNSRTHAFLPASPALDASVGSTLTRDQRSVLRPGLTANDLGAFEVGVLSLDMRILDNDIEIRLNAAGDTVEVYGNTIGQLITTAARETIVGVRIDGTTGDDSLTVNNANGLLTNGFGLTINFDGETAGPNTGPLGDRLLVMGDPGIPIDRETYLPGPTSQLLLDPNDSWGPAGAGSGLDQDEERIFFRGVSLVSDVKPVQQFDVLGSPANDDVLIADGPLVSGFATTRVASTGSFTPIHISNKGTLTVSGLDGADTITVDHANPSTGLTSIEAYGNELTDGAANTDDGSADLFQLLATSVPLTVSGQGGDDTAELGDASGSLDQVGGLITVHGDSGSDTLIVDDQGDTDNNDYDVTGSSIVRNGTALVAYDTVENLFVNAGSGDDTLDVDVDAGADGSLMVATFHGGDGEDVFGDSVDVSPSLITAINIDGGAPSAPALPGDTLNLDMSGVGSPLIIDTITGRIIFGGVAPFDFVEIETLNLNDGSGPIDNVDIGDLYVRAGGDRERIIFTLWNDGGVRLRLDNLTTRNYHTFPDHFGLDASGDQVLRNLVVFAGGSNDYVSVAGHVVDSNGDAIPVEFHGEEGDDYLAGGRGDDMLVGGPGNDNVLGGDGNNILFGDGTDGEAPTDGRDRLSGRSGDDVLIGGGGNDSLIGSAGADRLDGGSGADNLSGGADDDLLIGGEGNDRINAYLGNDVVVAGLGNDRLYGIDGRNLLIGGDGSDSLRGGRGDDTLVSGTTNIDTIPLDDNTTPGGFDMNAILAQVFSDWRAGSLTVPSLNPATDGDRDTLVGSSGADHFWATIGEDYLADENRDPGDMTFPL